MLLKSPTVKDLINFLQKYPEDRQIRLGNPNFGDILEEDIEIYDALETFVDIDVLLIRFPCVEEVG